MSCTHLTRAAKPASLLHRAFCRDCRRGFRADSAISFAVTCRKEQPIPAAVLERTLTSLDLPYSIQTGHMRWIQRVGRRARKPAAFVFAGAALAGFGWTKYIDVEPSFTITHFKIEGPNAYDEFKHAAAVMVEKDTLAKMLLPRAVIPTVYGTRAASENGPKVTMTYGVSATPTETPRLYSLEEKEGLLKLNAEAIEGVRIGLGKEYLAPPMRSSLATTNHYADARALARLLRVDSETHAGRKRWADAARSALDAVALGGRIQQNGGIIGSLSGSACESIGRDALWPLVDKLSASEASEAAVRLTRILNKRPYFIDALQEERNVVLANLKELMSQPRWRWTALSIVTNEIPVPAASWASYGVLLPFTKSRIVENTTRHMNGLISDASKNWEPYDPMKSGLDLVKPDPITAMMAPVYDSARFRDLASLTQSSMLINALQLRVYFAEHGRYPSTYDENVQGALRPDPFSNQRFVYRGFGDRYLLYSVGPDCLDNGGAPIATGNAQAGTASKVVQLDSRGDIIAGVNRW